MGLQWRRNLSFLYYTGTGVDRDFNEAAKWTLLAANQGYAIAQTDLGYLYERGRGVPLDYVSAYVWYSLGEAGDRRSSQQMKSLSKVMLPKELAKAKIRAAQMSHKWSQRPHDSGLGAASFFPSH